MPVVGISTARLRRLLGADIPSDDLALAIDRLGCDLEEVAEVRRFTCPACGGFETRLPREDPPKECALCGHRSEAPFPCTGADEVVRLDLLPARPDLFDSPGLARALVGYLGIVTGLPEYPVEEGTVTVTVDPSVREVRPEIACAEVDLPAIEQESLVEIMQLQENLHWAVGRDRKKASIGVYDLTTHGTDVVFTAKTPEFSFVPLGMPGREMTLAEILTDHPKGARYRHLLDGFDRYPILVDRAGRVLSMPPIINSEDTKLSVGATRLFIDVTGHDRRAVEDSLALVVTSLAELGGEVKGVRIEEGEDSRTTPDLEPFTRRLSRKRTERLIGEPVGEDELPELLGRMRLAGVEDGSEASPVLVPRYRVDVKHEVDLIEDVAIAKGYHELEGRLVPTMTVGREHPESRLAADVREVMTGLGYLEVLTLFLTNREDHYRRMGLSEFGDEVVLLNPISAGQEILRTHLLSSLMGIFSSNRTREMPQAIFEVGDVMRTRDGAPVQRQHLGVGFTGPRADYARIRSTMDALLHELGVTIEVTAGDDHELAPVFLAGRVARIRADGAEIGVMGEVDPEVITSWSLEHPVVLAEIDVMSLLPA